MRETDRKDSDDPNCKKSRTATEDPSREKLLRATAAPKCAKSRTDRVDPKRLTPQIANDDASRL